MTVRYGRWWRPTRCSLAVPRGCVYALLGRNGAGKSSLVRCLLGQQKPTSGRALLFGQDVVAGRAMAMQRIGVVPEEPDVPPEMTAAQTVAVLRPSLRRGGTTPGCTRRSRRFGAPTSAGRATVQGAEGAALVGAGARAGARAVGAGRPDAGPRRGGAPGSFYEELVAELADRGTTVLITSHDLAGVERIAERVGMLRHGKLVLDEDLETIKARFRRIRFGRRPAAQSVAEDVLQGLGARRVAGGEWGFEAVVDRFADEGLPELCLHRRGRGARGQGDEPGGDLHCGVWRGSRRWSMRGMLAVAQREIVERRMWLVAAAAAGLLPLLAPVLPWVEAGNAADARNLLALVLGVTLLSTALPWGSAGR